MISKVLRVRSDLAHRNALATPLNSAERPLRLEADRASDDLVPLTQVGCRILGRHPEWMEWLVLQNTNAYEEGFTAAWDGIRHALRKNPGPETEAPLLPFLDLEGIKLVYQHGHRLLEAISPDNWQMDFRFMERPNAKRTCGICRWPNCIDWTPGTLPSRTAST